MPDMKKPKKGKKPKKIEAKYPPGGPQTPGEKKKRERQTSDKANNR